MKPRVRLLAATSAMAVLVAGYSLATQLAAAQTTGLAQQDIAWHDCRATAADEIGEQLDEAGARCGEVAVPLDYDDPDGRMIGVALSRLPAASSADRVGVLFGNNGGPGGTGVDMPLQMMENSTLRERFDLIGIDPRFVGRSETVDCGWSTGSYVRGPGYDRESFDEVAGFQAELAQRCADAESDVLPYITTRNTARDFDVVRAALGESRVSYLGYSYGTYLGAVYAQLYPGRLDRVVLDGPVDPDRYGARMFADSAAGNEAGLTDWAKWAAKRDDEYGLGDSRHDVLSTVDEILAAADSKPLRLGEREADARLVPMLLSNFLADDRDEANAVMATTVATMAAAARDGSAEPEAELAQVLEFVATSAGSAYGSAQTAVLCGDARVSHDPDDYWADIVEHAAGEPRVGGAWRNISPCAFWPVEPIEAPTKVDTAVDALVVAATRDPRTPYSYADPLREAMGADSRLISLDARFHGVYNAYGDTCVDTAVTDYLVTGDMPRRDRDCSKG